MASRQAVLDAVVLLVGNVGGVIRLVTVGGKERCKRGGRRPIVVLEVMCFV